jgi:hypothetical protein
MLFQVVAMDCYKCKKMLDLWGVGGRVGVVHLIQINEIILQVLSLQVVSIQYSSQFSTCISVLILVQINILIKILTAVTAFKSCV